MKAILHMDIPCELEHLTPLYDFVLVKRLKDKECTESGLVWLPDNARNPEQGLRRGVVLKVGPGDKHPAGGRLPMNAAPGDEIVYPRVPANDIRLNGEEYVFLHEEQHILAVIERNSDNGANTCQG